MEQKDYDDAGVPSVEDGAAGENVGAEGASTEGAGKRPARYKVYDRIADNVSVHTMNIIVAVVALLLIGFVIYGIATGNPNP